MSLSGSDLPTSILFCRLCQSLYRQPRTLPCLHSFCHDCLRQVAPTNDSQGHTTLACPICGQGAPLTSAGVSALTSNEFLARMCQEYVSEVQKTLVTGRQFSPSAIPSGQGPISPTSVLAGRAPASGHFQFSVSPRSYTPSTSSTSPGGLQAHQHGAASPSHGTTFDYAVRGRQSSSGGGAALQTQNAAAASPPHSFLSSGHIRTSPRHSSSSSSASEVVLQTARRLSSEMTPTRGVGVQRRLSSTPRDVVRTWERLQRKLNSLQTACLQATYSLETVNMAESRWHQKKQDLRRDIQRRSAQLQFFIKRQERLLLAALDSRNMDDGFNSAADLARGDLRANLKALMHETDVLKTVLDLATDSELMSLSSLLLGSMVSQRPVSMETPELRFVVPEELSLEDMVGRDFGCLTSTPVTHSIFTPEDIDQGVPEDPEEDDAFVTDTFTIDAASSTGYDAASTASTDHFENGLEDMAYIDEDEEEEELVVEETFEIIDGKMQVVSKTVTPASQTRYGSQTRSSEKGDTSKSAAVDSKDPSTRGRGTDIRRTANSSAAAQTSRDQAPQPATRRREAERTEARQPLEGGGRAAPRSDTPLEGSEQQNVMEKFQNLRESLRQRRRELLLNSNVFSLAGHPGMAHLGRQEKRVQSLDRTTSMRDQSRRSSSPASPGVTASLVRSRIRSSDSEESWNSDTAVARIDSGPTVVETSITTSLVSPTERSSRPVRRAISAASDRASKMEYLRETWRKRKELLIQNEAYFTAPHAKPEEGGDGDLGAESKDSGGQENVGDSADAAHDHRSRIKQSIRSKISNLKQALKKNGKAEEGRPEARVQEKATSTSSSSDSPTKPPAHPSTKAEMAAEEKVLKTVESILQKKIAPASVPDAPAKPALPLQPNVTDTSQTTLASPGAKPSMVVKPRPREAPSAVAAPAFVAPPLETLLEDGGKTTAPPLRKSGLRLTSPGRGDVSKEKLQQVRENIRRKKERWRSLSLT